MKRIYIFLAILLPVSLLSLGGTLLLTKEKTVRMSHIQYVSLEKNKATPDVVRLPIGDFIQFNTKDDSTHNISRGQGNGYSLTHTHTEGIESGEFGKGEGYKVQVKKVGIYDFHDHNHPDIHVTVIGYNPQEK